MRRAQEKGAVRFRTIQLRDYSQDKHHSVDAAPFGGGEGMILRADVLSRALEAAGAGHVILLSPQGRPLHHVHATELTSHKRLILICGHYEGVDERFIQLHVDEEISIGDYVLTGGELPALVLADAVTRLLPGVVGNERSIQNDSLAEGLLKYPQYTQPRDFQGIGVPEVLLSGHHGQISSWRKEKSLEVTLLKRPDLLPKNVK